MPSLLLIVFVLQLAIHLINTFGANTINALLWQIYNQLPTSTSSNVAEQHALKAKFLKVRQEMNNTSSQDQFAKWAKIRREHDKLLEQLEKSKASTDSTKAVFDRIVSFKRWAGTNGLRVFLQFWYSRQPIFWLPKGWVPYYAEWLLSFPRAPLGSISIQAWALACGAMILLVSDATVALLALVQRQKGTGTESKLREQPIKSGISQAPQNKKDL